MTETLFLRQDITEEDILLLAKWMSDRDVTRFLNEDREISSALRSLTELRTPSYTLYLNKNGVFRMLCRENGKAVGFARIYERPNGTELVLAVGEKELWGRGIGRSAIRLLLSHAFFELRSEKAVAVIHEDNLRSKRAFAHCGFSPVGKNGNCLRYELTMADFLAEMRLGTAKRA